MPFETSTELRDQRDEARALYNGAQAEIAVLERERDELILQVERLAMALDGTGVHPTLIEHIAAGA